MRDYDEVLRKAAQRVADAVVASGVFELSKAAPVSWSTRLADEVRGLLAALDDVKGKPTACGFVAVVEAYMDAVEDTFQGYEGCDEPRDAATKVEGWLQKVGRPREFTRRQHDDSESCRRCARKERNEGCGHYIGEKSSVGLRGLGEAFVGSLPKGVTLEQARRALASLSCDVTPVPAVSDEVIRQMFDRRNKADEVTGPGNLSGG